jgi:hypothetical protein
MKSLFKSAAFLISMLVLSATASGGDPKEEQSEQPTVESVLNRYIDALGGREAVESQTGREYTGKQITDLNSEHHQIYQSLPMEAYASAPMNYEVQVWSDDGGYREGYDGTSGWVKDKCGVKANNEVGLSKQAFLLNPHGPLHVESYFPGLSFAGESTIDGEKVYALQPESRPPAHYTLYFSAESGLLVRIGYYWSIDDYREVDGVLVPHKITASRKGGSVVYELATVSSVPSPADSLFTMPE